MVPILRLGWTCLLNPVFILAFAKEARDDSLSQTFVRSQGKSLKCLRLSLSTL